MVSTFTGSFAAKLSSTLRVISLIAISPVFAAGPLETFFFKSDDESAQERERPIRDFFVKKNRAKPKPDTEQKDPILDFLFKDTDTKEFEELENEKIGPAESEEIEPCKKDYTSPYTQSEEEQWEFDCNCGCCN